MRCPRKPGVVKARANEGFGLIRRPNITSTVPIGDFHFASTPALGREGDGETVCDAGFGEILVLGLVGRLINEQVFIHHC